MKVYSYKLASNLLRTSSRKLEASSRLSKGSQCKFSSLSSGASSLTSQSTDVDLSYKVYPSENEADSSLSPLVFLHGLFGAKGNLHSVSKHLSSSGRKVITFDARNHGNSGHSDEMDLTLMAQDLSDLIGQLELKDPIVMGHSMGGKTAMTFALNNPDCLSSLIVADVAPNRSPGSATLVDYAKAMKKATIPQDKGITKARKKVEVQLASVVEDRSTLSFLLTNLVELPDKSLGWRINLDSFLANPESLFGFSLSDAQPFSKPMLFVFGANSAHYQEADQGQIKALFPNAQIEVIPDAGHFLHAEKPIEFVSVVQQFLKGQDAAR